MSVDYSGFSEVVSTIQLVSLSDAGLREAWPKEAQDLTLSLVENMGFLSDAPRNEPEASESDVAVESATNLYFT